MLNKPPSKNDQDERREGRVKMNFEVNLVYKGTLIKARYVDFSDEGIRISLKDSVGFEAGDEIELSLGNYELQGRIIWVDKSEGESILGLKVLGDRWPVVYPLVCPEGN